MENKNIVVKSEKKLNINYGEFIKELKESSLDIKVENKDSIIKLYNEIVNLKFNNIKRVDFRVKREENKDKLSNELKRLKVSKEEFNKLSGEVVSLSKEIKVSNYI